MTIGNGKQMIKKLVGVMLCLGFLIYSLLSNFVFCIDNETQHTQFEILSQHQPSHPHTLNDIKDTNASRHQAIKAQLLDFNCLDYVFGHVASFFNKLQLKSSSFVVIFSSVWFLRVSEWRHKPFKTFLFRRLLFEKVFHSYQAIRHLKTINIRQ